MASIKIKWNKDKQSPEYWTNVSSCSSISFHASYCFPPSLDWSSHHLLLTLSLHSWLHLGFVSWGPAQRHLPWLGSLWQSHSCGFDSLTPAGPPGITTSHLSAQTPVTSLNHRRTYEAGNLQAWWLAQHSLLARNFSPVSRFLREKLNNSYFLPQNCFLDMILFLREIWAFLASLNFLEDEYKREKVIISRMLFQYNPWASLGKHKRPKGLLKIVIFWIRSSGERR